MSKRKSKVPYADLSTDFGVPIRSYKEIFEEAYKQHDLNVAAAIKFLRDSGYSVKRLRQRRSKGVK